MLFVQAFVALLVYDLVITFRPFKTLYCMMKHWEIAETSVSPDTIARVCTAVNYACAWYPKRAMCLQRSFVTTYLMRQHGVPAQIVFGAHKFPFKAHAWVEVDGCAVNERSNVHVKYAVWDRC